MTFVHLNTHDIRGGAARAAYRLHRGLLAIAQPSLFVCREKFSHDHTVLQVKAGMADQADRAETLMFLHQQSIDNNRTGLSNTLFSLPLLGVDVSQLMLDLDATIIHLHWVAQFQSEATLRRLLALNKPVVWTLHDMWAFTGGCHYSAGCDRYQQRCTACPQLADHTEEWPAAVQADRVNSLSQQNFVIVTPSQWLAACARQSRVLQRARIEVIPYGLETDVFAPMDKPQAKHRLGIPSEGVTLLFGATSAKEERKGFHYLWEAIQICQTDARFQAFVQQGKVMLLTFGTPNDALRSLNLPIHHVGPLEDDAALAQCYAAADLLVLPSLQDNLPNTMLEAMSCGTPVIGFATGGIPDFVKDGYTGRLAAVKDTRHLATTILDCLFDPGLRQRMSGHCREMILQECRLTTQAQRYLALYHELYDQQAEAGRSQMTTAQSSPSKIVGALELPQVTELAAHADHTLMHAERRLLAAQLHALRATLRQAQQQKAALDTQVSQLSTGRGALRTLLKVILRRMGMLDAARWLKTRALRKQ